MSEIKNCAQRLDAPPAHLYVSAHLDAVERSDQECSRLKRKKNALEHEIAMTIDRLLVNYEDEAPRAQHSGYLTRIKNER